MARGLSKTTQKWLAVFGAFLLVLPLGLGRYWGNMSVYPLSFLLVKVHDTSGLQTPWVIPLYNGLTSVGLILVGLLTRRFGKFTGLLLGMVLFLGGFFSTYFTVQISVALMNVTVGVITGLGCGFVLGMAAEFAVTYSTNDIGQITAIVMIAFTSGPIIINELVTWYNNPENEVPDISYGRIKYFSQESILRKAPSLFLVFGSVFFVMQLVGLLVIWLTGAKSSELDPLIPSVQSYTEPTTKDKQKIDKKSYIDKDLNAKEILKTFPFYTLWAVSLFYTYSTGVVLSYYKTYGQQWIHDDLFLAWIGTSMVISAVIFTLPWGVATDSLGIKMMLVITNTITTIFTMFLYFAPIINKWMYFFAAILYGSSFCSINSMLMAATIRLFGKTHYSSNFGLVMSSDIYINVFAPLLMECILDRLGWFYTMFFAAASYAITVVLVIFGLPSC